MRKNPNEMSDSLDVILEDVACFAIVVAVGITFILLGVGFVLYYLYEVLY